MSAPSAPTTRPDPNVIMVSRSRWLGVSILVLSCLLSTRTARADASNEPAANALELRDRGLAQLENESPGDAAETFRQLVEVFPDDPLGWANLAVAALREQKGTQALAFVDRALTLAPNRSDVLHIRGDVLQWTGRHEHALAAYRSAAEADPGNVEALYSLYRQADLVEGVKGEEAAAWALSRLVKLRPENVVLLLHQGREAIDTGDRETASTTFLRLAELAWQGPEIAVSASDKVIEALAGPDIASARVPAARLENVLKVTPMYQQGLRELNTGIQGLPVSRFVEEPAPTAFGKALDLEWRESSLSKSAAVAVDGADFDGDRVPDLVVLEAGGDRVRVLHGADDWRPKAPPEKATGATDLAAVDVDNDGYWDVIATGKTVRTWRGGGDGALTAASLLPEAAAGNRLAVFDYDIEGDLDVVLGGAEGLQLWRNLLSEELEDVSARSLPGDLEVVHDLAVGDFDRDGDLDLAALVGESLVRLENLRQGEFVAHSTRLPIGEVRHLASGDFDGDGRPDLLVAGRGLAVLASDTAGFSLTAGPWRTDATLEGIETLDADNDGRLDFAATGPEGTHLFQQRSRGEYAETTVGSAGGSDLVARDLDADGDLDLVVAGPGGLARYENLGGNANGWLSLRLTGLTKGNSKNNVFGLGSVVELRAGNAYQYREAQSEVTHLGLGDLDVADLRVVWTNGVPQNRLRLAGDQAVVEEQLLKGSCPFLYAWTGEGWEFVTDLLWGAPIGLPVAEGVYAGADPGELVEVVGAVPLDGEYVLQITEELWEAAFFDRVRLWVVDHPTDVEVASNLRIVPGTVQPERVLASRDVRPVAAAWDGTGRDVTDRVSRRDEVYADGFERSRYQGRAVTPWAFTFDLGVAPNGPVRLHLDGWIFPSDASLNLALDQASIPPVGPRLEVLGEGGWEVLMPETGFPAGKTKTMILDTPPLPEGARKLRIVTSLWLGWDRIAWSHQPDDAAAGIVARLDPTVVDLHYRGFSQLTRRAVNGPHHFDYSRVTSESPWLPFPGRYTRYGNVRELLTATDDRSVILAPGDEMTVHFDAAGLPTIPPGHRRTLFLESQGWDKDADRNTGEGLRMEPLPFRAMTAYPYAAGESFPSTPELDAYRRDWLTRSVGGQNATKGDKTDR